MEQNGTTAMLHGLSDTRKNDARIRRILVIFGILVLIAAVVIVGAFIWRDNTHMDNPNETPSQIVTIAVTVLCGGLIIFFWGMKLTPLLAYRRYLKETGGGLSRKVEGVVIQVDEETTFRDALNFYGVHVNVGDMDNEEDERLLYWDAQLGRPSVANGERITVRAHGKDIIALEKQ